MGLFNKITIKKQKKRRDKQIEEAQKLMNRGKLQDANEYQKAYEILDAIIIEYDIISEYHSDIYDEYRMDEVKKMHKECIDALNKQAAKDVIIKEHTQYKDNAEEYSDNNATCAYLDDEDIRSYLEEEEDLDEFYVEVPLNKAVISESLKKDMHTEAKRRLDLFCSKKELTGIVLHYWDLDRVCCSMPVKSAGYIPPVDSNPVHIKVIKSIEQQFGCMIYHLIEEGNMLYALYVTPDKNCWQKERWNKGIMPVICCLAENPSDAHKTTAEVTSTHMVLTCKKTAYI